MANQASSSRVSSLSKSGSAKLIGDVTLSQGSNVTLTQTGQDISIASTGGGSSPLTTKGDLYTYSTLDTRLPVGTNGQVLSANSAQPTGLEWIAAGGTGTVTSVGSGNGMNFSSITTTGSVTLGTPSSLSVSSSNAVTTTSHTHAITSSSAPGAAASILATDSSGILGSTGTRIVKIWATDLTVTNAISGSITGNAGTATALTTPRTIGIATGDVTSSGSSFDGSANNTNAYTLATVNSNIGSFTNANITVNAKGLITAASSGTAPVTSISGTADRITVTGTTTPTIDIAATYVGQTSITTLGTITTGSWAGTNIALGEGGTGSSLMDPGADRIMFWDDSGSTMEWLTVGSGLNLTGTTLTATGGTGDVVGPAGASANTLAQFDGTSGKLIKQAAGITYATGNLDFNVAGNQAITGLLTINTYTVPASNIVGISDSQTLTNKTLTTPTIGSFANANHNHTNSAGGGQLTDAALSSAVTVPKGGTGQTTLTTAYGLLAAGTTATGAVQTLAAGATTAILVGGGSSALPVWTTASGTGSPLRQGSPTITTPTLGSAGYIADVNGNELLKFPTTVASAVNELTISNSATLSQPSIAATGGDTNIGIEFTTKGTGIATVNGQTIATASNSLNLTNKSIDGNGTGNSITNVGNFSMRYQSDTTNSTINSVKVETGWGFMTVSGTVTRLSETVTFPTAFSTLYSLSVSVIGAKAGSDPSGITDLTSDFPGVVAGAALPTTTSFKMYLETRSGGNFGANERWGYSWIAYGTY